MNRRYLKIEDILDSNYVHLIVNNVNNYLS